MYGFVTKDHNHHAEHPIRSNLNLWQRRVEQMSAGADVSDSSGSLHRHEGDSPTPGDVLWTPPGQEVPACTCSNLRLSLTLLRHVAFHEQLCICPMVRWHEMMHQSCLLHILPLLIMCSSHAPWLLVKTKRDISQQQKMCTKEFETR